MDKKSLDRIYLEHIVTNIPHYIFWKDTKSVYLGCNKNFATAAGLKSPKQVIGKTDYDLPWLKAHADTYRKEDKEILSTGQALHDKEVPIITIDGKKRIIAVSKIPLYGSDKKIIGILGIFTDITQRKRNEQLLQQAKERAEDALEAKKIAEIEAHEKSRLLQNVLEEFKLKRYYLTGEYQGIFLTKREAECGLCLARGNSAKAIGKILELSQRTVECHLAKVKTKLKVNTRSELITKLIECNFLDGVKPVL